MRARMVDGKDGEEQTLYPLWATKRTIRELLGICDKVLYILVADGRVGFVKTGDATQSAALYNFRDVLAWLNGREKRNVSKGGVKAAPQKPARKDRRASA